MDSRLGCEELKAASRRGRWARAWIRGPVFGFSAHDELTVHDLKAAWRRGAWRDDPLWRRRALAAVGLALTFVGVMASVTLLLPPPVSFYTAGLLVVGVARIVWWAWRG